MSEVSISSATVSEPISMETGVQARSREIDYPNDCTTEKARKKHKDRILRENPNTLYADYTSQNERRVKSDLIFYTSLIPEWKSAIRHKYQHVVQERIDKGERFVICHDETLDTSKFILKISSYTTGTVLVQGAEARLTLFEEVFPQLKTRVEKERDERLKDASPSPAAHQLEEREHTADEEASSPIAELTDDLSKLSA